LNLEISEPSGNRPTGNIKSARAGHLKTLPLQSLNPAKHGRVRKVVDWPYSSSPIYLEREILQSIGEHWSPECFGWRITRLVRFANSLHSAAL